MKILFFIIWIPFVALSQQVIDAEHFFSQVANSLNSSKAFENAEVRFPWIEEYEFRTRTNDFDLDKQIYTFRVSPSTKGKKKAQEELYSHYLKLPDFEQEGANCSILSDAYSDWMELYLLQEKIRLLKNLDSIWIDRQSVYEKMIDNFDFELDDLVKLQTAKSELLVGLNDERLKQEYLLEKYNLKGKTLVFDNFIVVENIEDRLNSEAVDPTDLIDAKVKYDKDLIEKELALERAEERQYLDFVQMRYEGPHSDLLDERLSLGIGFRLPNSGNRKLRIQELQLEKEELQRNELTEISEQYGSVEARKKEILKSIKALKYYTETITRERRTLIQLGKKLSQKEGFSPLLLLDIEERHIKTNMEEWNMREEILDDYLKYLFEAKIMCRAPLFIYLSD